MCLLAALWAGLFHLGWAVPIIQPGLIAAHGPLMVCGFLGTLIGLERAVALANRLVYAAPLLSGAGGIALVLGIADPAGPILITLGSLFLVLNFVAIIRRQAAMFTVTMGLGALSWLIGNCLWLTSVHVPDMFFWWAGFLVLTIVGERLELSRFSGDLARSQAYFNVALAVYLSGLALGLHLDAVGLRIAGAGMLLMAIWLWRFDLARRTVRQSGLTRFIAINLLAGFLWLGVAGVAWLWFGNPERQMSYDLMLHTLFLGFVFSMIFAHAPIIFPAVIGKPLPYHSVFYVHAALLHLSLLLRAGADLTASYSGYQVGGMLNALAIIIFIANSGYAIARGDPRKSRDFAQRSPDATLSPGL